MTQPCLSRLKLGAKSGQSYGLEFLHLHLDLEAGQAQTVAGPSSLFLGSRCFPDENCYLIKLQKSDAETVLAHFPMPSFCGVAV
jgi:hypothetical protein